MKTRTEFVSNSSSSSFIVYLDAESEFKHYIDDINKQHDTKNKLFDYVVVNIEKARKQKVWGRIKKLANNESDYTLNSLQHDHSLSVSANTHKIVDFDKFFSYWKMCPNNILQSRFEKSIDFILSESSWGIYDALSDENVEDYKTDLTKFLQSKNIKFKTQEAFV